MDEKDFTHEKMLLLEELEEHHFKLNKLLQEQIKKDRIYKITLWLLVLTNFAVTISLIDDYFRFANCTC